MLVNEQVPETVPLGVKVRGDLHVTVSFPGPVTLLVIDTDPAKPLVEAGLPRLVSVVEMPVDIPALKVRLVVFVASVKPLTLIVRTAEVFNGKPVALRLVW